nr:Nephrocystin-4 [Polyrhizophydium stewartii]
MSIFFHSNIRSPHLAVVVEFALLVRRDALASLPHLGAGHDPDELIPLSVGWTMFFPFNPKKNGFDPARIWRDDSNDAAAARDSRSATSSPARSSRAVPPGRAPSAPRHAAGRSQDADSDSSSSHQSDQDSDDIGDQQTKLRVAPVFAGSPRALLFLHAHHIAAPSGYPGLSPLGGSAVTFRLLARPDLASVCHLWPENSFVGSGDSVPGIDAISLRTIRPHPVELGRLSRIAIAVYPSIEKYEFWLLDRIAKVHFENHPGSLTPDNLGNLPHPVILERRLHVGFHNTRTFLGQPTIVTLKPRSRSDPDEGRLVFKGTVELDNYVPYDPAMVALVAVMEYKVVLTVNVPVVRKRSGLAGLIDRLASSDSRPPEPTNPTDELEKFVVTGWGAWCPHPDLHASEQTLLLETDSGPNPFGAAIYSPKFVKYFGGRTSRDLDRRASASDDRDSQIDERNRWPLALSFVFNEPERTARSEPQEAPNNDDEDKEEDLQAVPQIISPQAEDFSPFPLPQQSSLRPQLSRVEKARLHGAGFEMLLDDDGKIPAHITASSIKPDAGSLEAAIEAEMRDLRSSQISVLLQGLSFSADVFAHFGNRFPQTVYFSFQFFTFPHTTTERVMVYTGPLPPKPYAAFPAGHDHRAGTDAEHAWPGILYRLDKDGYPAYEQGPGLSLSFTVEARDEPLSHTHRSGPAAFPVYLARNSLFIDVWDGDTMLHLGSGCIDLRPCMRQGQAGVYFEDDVDIVWSEPADDASSERGRHRTGSAYSTRAHSGMHASASEMRAQGASAASGRPQMLKTATLHARVTHIGRRQKQQQQQPHAAHLGYAANLARIETREAVVVHDYHRKIKHREHTFHESKRLPEIDHELERVLAQTHAERATAVRAAPHKDAEGYTTSQASQAKTRDQRLIEHADAIIRKLDMTAGLSWPQSHASDVAPALPERFMYKVSREERERDLKTIDVFRERRRHDKTVEILRREITTKHTIHPTFGQASFFEFVFSNPYSADATFRIVWQDQELRLVVDPNEWLFHRRVHGLPPKVEKHLVRIASQGVAELFVERGESVAVPFVFQSFAGGLGGHGHEGVAEHAGAHGGKAAAGGSPASGETGIYPRTVSVAFLNTRDQPAAMLALSIRPRPYFVDRVIRLFRSEDELVRKIIRCPAGTGLPVPIATTTQPSSSSAAATPTAPGPGPFYDMANQGQIYVRSNMADAVCALASSRTDASTREITFKYRVGAAPGTHVVYILFYTDPFHTTLSEVWRVFVHSLFRFDMNCVFGQTTPASLVLRGSSMSRPVMCFTNLPQEIMASGWAWLLRVCECCGSFGRK